MIGKTISHYSVLEKLGEGGMGVVYKAKDITLDRIVALKFLPARFADSEEERMRFLQEARAASALNHSNVATIHEIAEAEGETFLVMEYVDGKTLRAKTEPGPLTGKEPLQIAIQSADAIQKAHEKGIIHRDIKSENIMVTTDGRVKVMDFGLARLKGGTRVTKPGSTVGTAAYMSPEQIQGMEVDARADIFSFGVVLYELYAGKLPFRGEHESALMYEVVNVHPPLLADAVKDIDPEINRIVMKCLEKDRDERYQSMRDVLVDLRHHDRDSGDRIAVRPSLSAERKSSREGKLTPILLAIAAICMVALLAVIWIYVIDREPAQERRGQGMLSKLTSKPGLEDEPTWSPDGKFIAYTTDERGNLDIVVQPVGGGQEIRVADSPADEAQPAWSPDGGKLAFVSARDHEGRLSIALGMSRLQWYMNGKGGDIFLVPALGGTPVKLVENGYYPAWSPDGKQIVFQSNREGTWDLWTISLEGGVPERLTSDEIAEYHPHWSADGEWIVYGAGLNIGPHSLRVVPARGGEAIDIVQESDWVVGPEWSADGTRVLYSSFKAGFLNIWTVPFSPTGDEVVPTRVTTGEGNDVNISVAPEGTTVAFATLRNTPDIWELTLPSENLRQVTLETSSEDQPNPSPDGRILLIESDRGGTEAVWSVDMEGKILSQVSSGETREAFARWAPDGSRLAYTTIEGNLVVQKYGDISAEEIVPGGRQPVWSPDGSKIAFAQQDEEGSNIWVYSFATGESKQITFGPFAKTFSTWSPDGRQIAYQVQSGDVRHIMIVPSEGGTPVPLVSGDRENSHPQWSPTDPDQILFVRDHKNLFLASVGTTRERQITHYEEANLILDYPSWAFDGKKVYFSLARKIGDLYILKNY
jgi:Tol biopolymer transport system component/predicted Ser/Thr protein kinase